MIPTPYMFEPTLSDQDFAKIGQFTLRWSHMDHTIGNCLRRILGINPKTATVLIFPLSLDARMNHISKFIELQPLDPRSDALFEELKPLIKAMQYIRNSAIHGIVIDMGAGEEPYFELRSKGRKITMAQLFACEDLINYAAHVTQALRISLGEEPSTFSDGWSGYDYALPDRPVVPDWLPQHCRTFPPEDKLLRESNL